MRHPAKWLSVRLKVGIRFKATFYPVVEAACL